jgi:hypothetical protein
MIAKIEGTAEKAVKVLSLKPGQEQPSPDEEAAYPEIASFDHHPPQVLGHHPVTLTVTLDKPAPFNVPLQVTSYNNDLLFVPNTPKSIPQGQTTWEYTVDVGNTDTRAGYESVRVFALLPYAPTSPMWETQVVIIHY